ncbi:hypothetical protein FH965_14630 [Streptomyces spectabilis]|uniref:Uncharacterized protein n=2 Tax=Streptomyces spectabilis TaxID=68270 RepID=A0A516RL02_STRST|nr:hypothetical protein [Streptomyces spectabilis]QDQ16334.1 hypothetical protein FH965_14630 [Streptomyces spectabilis]
MRFHLEVECDETAAETTHRELSRILRYWAGNLRHYELTPGATEKIYDSEYNESGSWTISH